LLAQFALSTRQAAADRRALLAEALHTELGTDEAVAEAVSAHQGRSVSRPAIEQVRRRAVEVKADPVRYAAALALGGPIPTASTARRA